MTRAEQRNIGRLHSIVHRKHEKKAVKLLNRMFAYQSNLICIFVFKYGIASTLAHLDQILGNTLVQLTLRRIWFSIAKDYVSLLNVLKVSKSGNGPKTSHTTYMEAYSNSPQAMSKVRDINDETRKILRETLQQGLSENLHKTVLGQRIREATAFSQRRSLLIARTETTLASNLGAFEGASSTGEPLLKYWIATQDNRTRDAHSAMDSAKGIPMDEPFDVGGEPMMFPGDPTASADNACNCRCVVAFKVSQNEPIRAGNEPLIGSHGQINQQDSSTGGAAWAAALLLLINQLTASEETADQEE